MTHFIITEMKKRINYIKIIIIVISTICIILGILSNWREYNHRKSCIAAKASIISVDIKPMSGKAIASINYSLSYLRDNALDTIEFSTTNEYYLNEPLHTIEKLKKVDWYVHYIPAKDRSKTTYKDEVFIRNDNKLESSFNFGWFNFMIVVLVIGYLLDVTIYRRQ